MLACYLITLSARTSTFGGIVRPICFAAFRLMISSNFSAAPPAGQRAWRLSKFCRRTKSSAPGGIGAVGPVGHHAAAGDKISPRVNRRQAIFYRQVRDPFLIRKGQRVRYHGETGATRLNRLFERALEIVSGDCVSPWNEVANPVLLPAVGFLSNLAQRLHPVDSTAPQRGRVWERFPSVTPVVCQPTPPQCRANPVTLPPGRARS